jgi:hypothetical protein
MRKIDERVTVPMQRSTLLEAQSMPPVPIKGRSDPSNGGASTAERAIQAGFACGRIPKESPRKKEKGMRSLKSSTEKSAPGFTALIRNLLY